MIKTNNDEKSEQKAIYFFQKRHDELPFSNFGFE